MAQEWHGMAQPLLSLFLNQLKKSYQTNGKQTQQSRLDQSRVNLI